MLSCRSMLIPAQPRSTCVTMRCSVANLCVQHRIRPCFDVRRPYAHPPALQRCHRTSGRCYSLADSDSQNGSPSTSQQVPATAQPGTAAASPPAAPLGLPAVGGAAAAFGAVLFVATRLLAGGPSLASLESNTIPLEQALNNGKPTVLEFYASWCEVCRELVPTEYAVQQNYKDKVNFVMLNIDNTKWVQEVADYRVVGIPHFVFLDEKGTPLSAAVGRLPAEVLDGNTKALAQHQPLPYNAIRAQASSLDAAPPSATRSVGPRDHA